MADRDCWFCRSERGDDAPPGGWIYEDDKWRVWHGQPDWGPAGTTIVESRRHFLDFSDMEAAEAASFIPLMSRVFDAIKAAVRADRVYTWSTMDRHPHLHLWLIPWWEDAAERGPRYLVSALEGDGCTEGQALDVVARMRDELSTVA